MSIDEQPYVDALHPENVNSYEDIKYYDSVINDF